jgi:IS4 transposase
VQLLIRCRALVPRFVLVMDASFLPKSGRQTYGLGSYWNSCAGRAESGLELSCIALMSWVGHHVFPISLRQTRPKAEKADRLKQYLDQLRVLLRKHRVWLRTYAPVLVADGQYAKRVFFDLCRDEGFAFVTKLAVNANLLIPFTGQHPKRRGGRQKWEKKVDFCDFAGWTGVAGSEREQVWTRVVWAPHFGCYVRVIVIQTVDLAGKVRGHVVLCSTDTGMPAEQIRALYSARFQLEFVFRDAKQHASLTTCQLRSKKGLENHWNASMLTVSLARAEQLLRVAALTGQPAQQIVFSMEDAKRRAFNLLFAQRILANLGLSQRFEELQNHPTRPLDLGVKAA